MRTLNFGRTSPAPRRLLCLGAHSDDIEIGCGGAIMNLFTQYRHDLHQDHRTICELTWNTFRNHLILEYEIPKYDGDLGSPNVFFPLERKVREQKVRNILGSFKSQRGKQWFTRETFLALMRLRGVECNAPHGAAEAFYG